MKKIITITIVLSLCLHVFDINTYAQNEDQKWAVGVIAGKNEYKGDIDDAFFDWSKAFYGYLGLTVNRYVSPSFDLRFEGTMGRFGRWIDNDVNFKGMKTDLSLMFSYKLNNGYLLPADSWFAPSLLLGPGVAFYNELDVRPGGIDDEGMDLLLATGLSLRFQLTNRFALQFQSTYNMLNSDNRDLVENDENDKFLKHHAGFIINLGPKEKVEPPVDVVDLEKSAEGLSRNNWKRKDNCVKPKKKEGVPKKKEGVPKRKENGWRSNRKLKPPWILNWLTSGLPWMAQIFIQGITTHSK